jgi:VanZ family protein
MKKEIEKIGTTIINKTLKNPRLFKNISIIFGTLTLVWTMVIFSFSTQTASKSSQVSEGLLEQILKLIKILTSISIDPIPLCGLFRKLAHFSEFFVLGILSAIFCYFLISHLKIKKTDIKFRFQPYLYSLLYGIFIAVADEALQFYVGSGRAMQFTDMLIDSSGVIVALLIIWKLYNLQNKNGGFWLFC